MFQIKIKQIARTLSLVIAHSAEKYGFCMGYENNIYVLISLLIYNNMIYIFLVFRINQYTSFYSTPGNNAFGQLTQMKDYVDLTKLK